MAHLTSFPWGRTSAKSSVKSTKDKSANTNSKRQDLSSNVPHYRAKPMNSISIWDQPALEPPSGVVPDFATLNSSHASGYGFVISSSAVSLVAVLARLISSASRRKLVVEDALMIAALVRPSLFSLSTCLSSSDLGKSLDRPLATASRLSFKRVGTVRRARIHVLRPLDISRSGSPPMGNPAQVPAALSPSKALAKHSNLGSMFYSASIMLIKAAILVSWLRIFVPAGQRNNLFWVCHALIWTNVIFYIVAICSEAFRCWPREKIWNPLFQGGHCSVDVKKLYAASSTLNVLSDSAILAVPQFVIWKLQMPRARKWGLSLLFVIGIGAWVFGVTRLVYIVKLLSSNDVVYILPNVAIWSVWEVTAGFLVLGIPAMPAAFKALPFSGSFVSFLRLKSQGSDQRGLSPVAPSPMAAVQAPTAKTP
ncbi:hypothetical protein AAL_06914 [Moelleriella libera RCEF 2490]|uniref:Rhodopsin domain-containing protein n=1 Tax=Moelleriella libera RCEF 2490 TaxID=1081109 RepID=A0A162IBN8_9HYPO|nr:hypothetical protein AAL_06914 [Moelleriella libera RCEF 2490]